MFYHVWPTGRSAEPLIKQKKVLGLQTDENIDVQFTAFTPHKTRSKSLSVSIVMD